MVILKTPEQIEIMREGGSILASMLAALAQEVKPDISTAFFDDLIGKLCEEYGATPVLLGYKPYGASRPYPARICVSINDEVVHGIPDKKRLLKEGDIVSLDMTIRYKGFIVDSAITVPVGKVDKAGLDLIDATERAMYAGINAAKLGAKTGDIGKAIEKVAKKHKYGLPEELGGHGIGHEVHEDPFVPNFGKAGQGVALKNGMVFTIEPMVNEGTKKIYHLSDGYTIKTLDKKRSAHFEHTVAIVDGKAEVLTTNF